jgi:selenophosphate synthase
MTVMTSRLTSYAHGGGCACKIAPGELERMVAGLLVPPPANPEARWWWASTMVTTRRSFHSPRRATSR